MTPEATRSASSHRSEADAGLGVESVCCLLHNVRAGGSTRQWLRLLARHVERGGRATILAPPGPLSGEARESGIEVVDAEWGDEPFDDRHALRVVAEHEVAIVHWDHRVMNAFEPALSACGRAALTVHQTPHEQVRWMGPWIVDVMRSVLERAAADPRAVILVRGESHRARFVSAFGLPWEELRILPPSIPLPPGPFPPAPAELERILALTRLSVEKAAIVGLAVELARARIDAGRPCRLTIAGEGDWREEAVALCESRLPSEAWVLEGAPEHPIARLADADLVVAQGLTTIEAAAQGRRVVVARGAYDGSPGGMTLTPARYDLAARDPFGRLPVRRDAPLMLAEAAELSDAQLDALRGMVARFNSLEAGGAALADALARTA